MTTAGSGLRPTGGKYGLSDTVGLGFADFRADCAGLDFPTLGLDAALATRPLVFFAAGRGLPGFFADCFLLFALANELPSRAEPKSATVL